MACFNCTKGYYCQFHRGSTKLVTSIAYSKTYHVFDLINGTNKSIIQRDKDREKNYYIEIEEKTATCTKCHSLSNRGLSDDMSDIILPTHTSSRHVS